MGLAPSGLAISPDEDGRGRKQPFRFHQSHRHQYGSEKTDLKIPAYPEGTLGSQPIEVAFAPDGKTLYVACAGTSTLAVVRTGSGA